MGRAKRPGERLETAGWTDLESAINWADSPMILPVGLPGSGKSTWARWISERQKCSVISADTIRLELFSSLAEANSRRENNKRVFALLRKRLDAALLSSGAVIVDATNLYPHARQPLYQAARQAGRKHEIIFFQDRDLAFSRNRQRATESFVPEDAMRRMYLGTHNLLEELKAEGPLHII